MTLTIDTRHAEQVKIRFTWPEADPTGVMSVVGSFNDWTPGLDELIPDGRGVRSVTIGLPYGERFVFRYLAEDGHWFDEPQADEITELGSVIHPIQHG